MKAHGHYFSSEIPWESSVRSHGHNTTILILNFNEKHKCYLEQEHYETLSEYDWLGYSVDNNKWRFSELEVMLVIIKTKEL